MATKQSVLNLIDTTVENLDKVSRMTPGGPVTEESVALAQMGAEAYRLVKEIAASGHDPAEVIARMREARVWLDGAEAEWRKAMDAKFGGSS